MIQSIPDVSYIVVGSKDRLSKIKSYQIEDGTECILCPFSSLAELPSILDSKIAALDSKVIALIPVGTFPRKIARSQLLHFARCDYQFWGWQSLFEHIVANMTDDFLMTATTGDIFAASTAWFSKKIPSRKKISQIGAKSAHHQFL